MLQGILFPVAVEPPKPRDIYVETDISRRLREVSNCAEAAGRYAGKGSTHYMECCKANGYIYGGWVQELDVDRIYSYTDPKRSRVYTIRIFAWDGTAEHLKRNALEQDAIWRQFGQ